MDNEHADQNLAALLRAMAAGRSIKKTESGFRLAGPGERSAGGAIDPRWISAGLRAGFIAPTGGSNFALTSAGRKHAYRAGPQEDRKKILETRLVCVAEGEPVYATVNVAESPLAWLRSRAGGQSLTADEFAAGEKLRDDFTRARMSPATTMNWERPLTSRGGGFNAVDEAVGSVIAARKRFAAALASVGPGLNDVLVSVCCELQGLEACERRLQWPRRSAKLVLKFALQRLARHYGLTPERAQAG